MSWLGNLFKSTLGSSEGRLTIYDIDQNRLRWQKIEEQKAIGKPSNLRLAILEADKIVDESLKHIFPNQPNMAERLKLAKNKFSNRSDYEDLWYAHKVRNTIAHEISYDLPSFEAVNILEKFRKSLQELGGL